MTKLEKFCIGWLNDSFNNMKPFIMKEYPDYLFHMKDGKCILQYNIKNRSIYVNYKTIWRIFEIYFDLSNQQIKDILKIWVEELYKIGVTTTENSGMVVENYKENIIRKCVITDGEELAEREYKKIKVEEFDNGLKINGYRPPFVTEQVERRYDYDIITTNNQSQFYFENEVNKLYDRHINE